MKIVIKDEDFNDKSPEEVMDQVVDFLLDNGNSLAREPRWGSNPTGYQCLVLNDIDFAALENNFDFPEAIILIKKEQIVDYGYGTVRIRKAQS